MFDSFKRVEFAVEPAAGDPVFAEVGGQVFGEPFGEGGDENTFLNVSAFLDLFQEVSDLSAGGRDFDSRVEQTSRSNNLFDDFARRFFKFIVTGRRRNKNDSTGSGFPFLKLQRAVVEC